MKRPRGIAIIAVVLLIGGAFLTLGSLTFFVVGVMGMTGGDGGEPISVAIAGMGLSGGFLLSIFSGSCIGLAISLLRLRNWARLMCVGSAALGLVAVVMSFLAQVTHFAVGLFASQLLAVGVGFWVLKYLVRPQIKSAFGTPVDHAKRKKSFVSMTTRFMSPKQAEPASMVDSRTVSSSSNCADSSQPLQAP